MDGFMDAYEVLRSLAVVLVEETFATYAPIVCSVHSTLASVNTRLQHQLNLLRIPTPFFYGTIQVAYFDFSDCALDFITSSNGSCPSTNLYTHECERPNKRLTTCLPRSVHLRQEKSW